MDENNAEKQETGTLPKTVSSPTSLYAPIVNIRQTNRTPTLGQIGRQTSLNVRLSQLYDSGAESGDADDSSRLLPAAGSGYHRPHKFIIIPSSPTPVAQSTSPTPTMPAKTFRQTVSTSALGSLTLQSIASKLSHIVPIQAGVTKAANEEGEASKTTNNKSKPNLSKLITTATTPPSLSDINNQTNGTASLISPTQTQPTPTTIPSSSGTFNSPDRQSTAVTFTLDDCEAEIAADCDSLPADHHHHHHQAINGSSAHATPSPQSLETTTFQQQQQYGGTSPASPPPPTLAVHLRPHNEQRNTGMRTVVSAYYNTDTNQEALFQQFLQTRPTSMVRELSTSSCIFRDQSANQIYSDVTSVRSLASIGIGSTDGRKLVIKRVPQSPLELFNIVNPPTIVAPGMDDDDDDSFLDVSDDTNKPRQQKWGSKMQFVLACIGYSVGLGNVWRFPYMCYKSGGGVFLVPYCIILIVCSIPLLFMELSVGQYTGRGPIGALGQLCPLFKGAGLASVVVSFLMSTYYSVIIGYSIYYFFTAFRTHIPWIDCSNRWNTIDCWVPQRVEENMTAPNMSRTPSEEFFENKVLQISPGLEYPGEMRWELFACLICAWLMVYFATWKSIKSSAKVRYFTATFPFVLIIILMGRAVTLDGADQGLRYFFRPNWSELKNANVWINAASQNFNSLGITFGSMISFASYNKYNNNILRDTIAVSVVNILTSLLVGVFAFATLGNLALEQNTNVKDVIGDGPGLIFVVYPQAMAKMPYAQLWAVMFFFMLLCLGLNSQFAIVEVVVTSIQDGFPNWIKRNLGYHEIVVLFVCVISFLFGLPNLIQGGIYYFQLMDHYAASVTIMFLAFCQMIAIAWFYGTGRLSKNVKQMTGKAPSLYLKSSWLLFGPALLFAIWILSLINYEEPSYHNGRYKYPEWAYGIGWMFASFSLVCIPGYAIINLLRASGNTFWERVKFTLNPNIYECRICGEHHCEHDYPEQEQYMLAQEMAGMYKPTTMPTQSKLPSALHHGTSTKTGYNPMYLQAQHQLHHTQLNHKHPHEEHHTHFEDSVQEEEAASPPTTATTATS